MHGDAVAEPLGQVSPRQASAEPVEHGFNEQTIVLRRHANMAQSPGKKVLYAVPLVVTKAVAPHWSAPYQRTRYELKFHPRRNPLNDDTP